MIQYKSVSWYLDFKFKRSQFTFVYFNFSLVDAHCTDGWVLIEYFTKKNQIKKKKWIKNSEISTFPKIVKTLDAI